MNETSQNANATIIAALILAVGTVLAALVQAKYQRPATTPDANQPNPKTKEMGMLKYRIIKYIFMVLSLGVPVAFMVWLLAWPVRFDKLWVVNFVMCAASIAFQTGFIVMLYSVSRLLKIRDEAIKELYKGSGDIMDGMHSQHEMLMHLSALAKQQGGPPQLPPEPKKKRTKSVQRKTE